MKLTVMDLLCVLMCVFFWCKDHIFKQQNNLKRWHHFFYADCCIKVFDWQKNRIFQITKINVHKSNKDVQIEKDVWGLGVSSSAVCL